MKVLLTQLVYWHWFALALILGIIDVTVGANFFFVWCGVSAAVVGVILFFVPSLLWEYQLFLFGVGVLGSVVFWHHYLKSHPFRSSTLNRRAEQYVGRVFTLEAPIENGRGKVRVDDSYWRVEGPDMPAGQKVKVIDVDGVVLKVEKVYTPSSSTTE